MSIQRSMRGGDANQRKSLTCENRDKNFRQKATSNTQLKSEKCLKSHILKAQKNISEKQKKKRRGTLKPLFVAIPLLATWRRADLLIRGKDQQDPSQRFGTSSTVTFSH